MYFLNIKNFTKSFNFFSTTRPVQFMVHMPVNFLVSSRFLQKPPQNSHSLHPHVLDWSSGVGRTESFTHTGVSSESSGGEVSSCSGSTVDSNLLFDDKTIFDVSSDVVSTVGVADGQGFIWVQPNLVFTAIKDGRGEPFL